MRLGGPRSFRILTATSAGFLPVVTVEFYCPTDQAKKDGINNMNLFYLVFNHNAVKVIFLFFALNSYEWYC